MAGFVAVPGGIQCEMIHDLSGVPVVNVLHLKYTGAGDNVTNLSNVMGQVGTAWVTYILPQLSVDLTLTELILTDLKSQTAARVSASVSDAGGESGDILAANTALCVSLHETMRYRGGHGRMYLGGIPQSMLDTPRSWTSAYATDVKDAVENFQAAVNAITFTPYDSITWSILHARMSDTHPVPPNPTYLAPFLATITSIGVDLRVDSQRRRTGS